MNDNLPEINFKEKKEKKGGAFGWLSNKLGIGSRGGAMGGAGLSPTAMNVGRALGTAKFGASSGGLAGLLAGKLGVIATIAVVAAVGGLYVVRNAPAPAVSTGAFSSGKTSNYVPAILRGKDQGSSLDMFKDTNKGAGLAMEADPNAAKKAPEANSATADEAAAQDPNQPAPEQGNMGQDMMGKLQGAAGGSLTSSLGGGSSKFSSMGGFGNKFGQGATGAKAGFTSGIGAGFGGMPKFDARKNKMLAMKGAARPVFSGAKAGGKGSYGPKSLGQAKGLRNMQKTYTGSNVDSARSTQDKAWEGSTAEGDAGAGGAGLADGGAGVMTSPSLDTGGSGGGGGGGGTAPDPIVPPSNPPTDVSPWAGLLETVMSLILISAVLSLIGAELVKSKTGWVVIVGYILCIIAAVLAVVAMVMAAQIMSKYGQKLLGTVYLIGAGAALAAAIMGMMGKSEYGGIKLTWLLLAAGVIGLMGSMFAGK